MLISRAGKALKLPKFLSSFPRFSLTHEEYFEGKTNEAFMENLGNCTQIKSLQIHQLDQRVKLYGLPFLDLENGNKKEIENVFNEIENAFQNRKSTIFTFLDPSVHITQKQQLFSFLRDKFIYKGVIETKGEILSQNPCKLIHPYQCLLEPAIVHYQLEMSFLKSEGRPESTIFSNSSASLKIDFSTPESKEKLITELSKVLTGCLDLNDYIGVPEFMIKSILINYLNENTIFLAQVPEIYKRIAVSSAFSLEQLQELFKESLSALKRFPEKTSWELLTSMLLNNTIESSEFFYLRSLLNEVMEEIDDQEFSLIVPIDKFDPFRKYWEIQDVEHSFSEAFNIPIKADEPDEREIEKHALLDVLLGGKLWQKDFVKNPFPYLSEDFLKLGENDQKDLKKRFFVQFKKYEKIMTEFLK